MDLINKGIRQPVTVTVGVLLVLLSGFLALQRIPIQLTPNVEDTVVAVTTLWEGANPQEVEQEIVDEQEEKLQGIAGLKRITSVSQQGQGQIRLEFNVGTSKEEALREVSDKLREVPRYPENVDEPVIEASDPENRDFIAWIVFESSDPSIDVRTLRDFAEDRIKPTLERVTGISEINVLGGREREVQIRFDPFLLAQYRITIEDLVSAIQRTNENTSAGALTESKSDVRLRLVSQYESIEQVEATLVAQTDSGPIYVRDLAEIEQTFKESTSFVRSRGKPVIAINAQREVGTNVMEVMDGLRDGVARLNAPDGLLESYARRIGLNGELSLTQVYDQTTYIEDALALVQSNIWIGGGLAIMVLLLFLRSLRSAGIIALAIPISVIGAVVFMVAMGRSVNVISLAGMAFAVGMVVDNAIVVLENIFRHLELGKHPMKAALDGTSEVFGAVVAATLTTVVVFIPILLVEEEAGQLFRDIALAIVAAVSLSLFVSVTVIPTSAARILRPPTEVEGKGGLLRGLARALHAMPTKFAGVIHFLCGSRLISAGIVLALTAFSLFGTWLLLPPADYLPVGNRNLAFGLIIPPPGTSVQRQELLGLRVEDSIRPFFEAGRFEPGTSEYERAVSDLPSVPTFDFARMQPGTPIVPAPLSNYFLVSFVGAMFHGGICAEPERVVDALPLFRHAARAEVLPGSLAYAFQVPLFQLGGRSGSAVEINFSGDELDQVTRAAGLVYQDMIGSFGPFSIQPNPSNFDLPTPELQIIPNLRRLGEVGLTPAALGLMVQALGDGALIGDYLEGSQTIDLKLISRNALGGAPLAELGDQPVATVSDQVLPLSALAELRRVNAPGQINRDGRQRAVSLQFTPPPSMPLEQAISRVEGILREGRESGKIPFDVITSYAGSASKLDAVKSAMLGDGTVAGTLSSSLVLALLVVYLLMSVLFQSFLRPLIIMFSVPLATFGGFAALYGVHLWSTSDPYMPIQKLDILTMLGFVILIGVVVNNAILIVHQSINFMRGAEHEDASGSETSAPLPPREAISEAVRTRVRPIFMSTLTSVGGMSPLIFMPGSGSELYRGLGSVVVGGLLLSTIFTLFLVPLLLSLVSELQQRLGLLPEARQSESVGLAPASAGPRVGAALALLLVAALGLSCTASQPARQPLHRLAAEILRSELSQAQEKEVRVREFTQAKSTVDEVLGGRMEELEQLGGPASYEGLEPQLSEDLLGRPQVILSISLERAVASSVQHNLGVQLARTQSRIDEAGVMVETSVFDSVVFSTLAFEDLEEPNRLPVVGGVVVGAGELRQERETAQVGMRKLLKSGATVSISGFLERQDDRTNGIAFDPDPAWRSGVTLGLSQPLLRGFGNEVTTADLELGRYRRDMSEEDLKAELLFNLALTEQAYWDLEEAWKQLRIRQRLTDQGVEVERVLRERLDFDVGQAEYSDALATTQRRRAQLLRAERLVEAASDNLKVLINDPQLSLASEVLLTPADESSEEPPRFQLGVALTSAIQQRPEVQRSLLEIEDAQLRERVAANSIHPQLDLDAALSYTGLEDSSSSTIEDLTQEDQVTLFLGFSLEHPIGARGARAELRQAQLRGRESLLRYEETLRQVIAEVKDALRDVETNYALIAAARSTRIAETENLRAILLEEQNRNQLTPEFLNLKFQRQERLALAQLEEVEAFANYNRALAAYYRAIGTGMRSERILLESAEGR